MEPEKTPTPAQVVPLDELSGKAKTSLILGIIGMVAWLLPLAGFPVTIVGLVKGIKSIHSVKKGWATAGVVLCIIGLVLTTINAGIGAYMGATGQYSLIPNSTQGSKY